MRKYLIICSGIILLSINSSFCQKGKIQFNQNGEFKIVQFTDLHIQKNVSEAVFELAQEIVELEKPDLVVITGDVVFQDSVDHLLLRLAKIFADKKIPWVAAFGNHDDEFGISRKTLTQNYRSLPYNLNSSTRKIKGETNFIIPIAGKMNGNEALLYFFDSNSYNPLKDRVNSNYGWIEFSQINWYRNRSAYYTKKNNGTPVPSLSFFHIPLPEYEILWEKDSTSCIGVRNEDVCCPYINSGLYASMTECGDVMGTFVGHDHINDYIGKYNNIALAYGRFSGSKNVYGFLKQGVRVIVLTEGKREFNTWIREKGGNIVYKCKYPDSFNQKIN